MVHVSEAGVMGVHVIEGLDTAHIIEILGACKQPYDDSMLYMYSAGADAKFVGKSTRLSKFRAIVDQRLFDATAAMLRNMLDGFCNESVYGTLNLLRVTGVVASHQRKTTRLRRPNRATGAASAPRNEWRRRARHTNRPWRRSAPSASSSTR